MKWLYVYGLYLQPRIHIKSTADVLDISSNTCRTTAPAVDATKRTQKNPVRIIIKHQSLPILRSGMVTLSLSMNNSYPTFRLLQWVFTLESVEKVEMLIGCVSATIEAERNNSSMSGLELKRGVSAAYS